MYSEINNVDQAFCLTTLPWALDALEPHISKETLEYHHGKHHRGYVEKLNKLVLSSPYSGLTLEQLVKTTKYAIFNNAAQVWNHDFYWQCLAPNAGGQPEGAVAKAINETFGSYESFVEQFTKSALSKFGSGWTWLVRKPDGALAIINTNNADNPMRLGNQPLLVCDVWEHAYYLDHRNARDQYIAAFFHLLNWKHVAEILIDTKKSVEKIT